MKKYFAIILLMLLVAVPLASAETGMKVGLVNFQKALNEVQQGKTAKENLKKDFDARQKKLDLMQTELQKMQKSLEEQRFVMSDDILMKKQEEFRKKYLELQQKWTDFRQELGQKEAELSTKIIGNLAKLVQEVGEKGQYTMIVETSQGGVVYIKGGEDITDEVIKLYNKSYKGIL